MSTSGKEAAAQLRREELIERIDLLCKERRFPQAFQWERRLVDEFHEEYMLPWILRQIHYSEKERRQMMESDDASALFLVGFMLHGGRGGARRDNAAAYRCFERASELGHVFARHWCGYMLYHGYGVAKDQELALQLVMEAAQRGCGAAADSAGMRWLTKGDYRQAAYYHALAVTLHHNNNYIDNLLREHPMRACPFGEWKPTRLMYLQVPPKIKTSMFTALLVFRARLAAPTRVPRYVALLILSYICTNPGWDATF